MSKDNPKKDSKKSFNSCNNCDSFVDYRILSIIFIRRLCLDWPVLH